MRKLLLPLVTASLIAAAGSVFAQATGPNGGLLGGTGSHKAELVVGPAELTLYLIEDGKVMDSKGASFRAVVQQGGKTTTINFADQGGQKLLAKLAAPLEKGAIVVVTGKDGHGDQVNARYVIK
jgi:hypothetical protein